MSEAFFSSRLDEDTLETLPVGGRFQARPRRWWRLPADDDNEPGSAQHAVGEVEPGLDLVRA